jgi:hypothetical protein
MMWLRHQPGSALSRWFQQRVGVLQGRLRRIAAAALARKLLVALWRYLETGLVQRAPCSRANGEAARARRSPTSRGGCVTAPGQGCASAAIKMGPIRSEPDAPAAAWGTLVRGCAPTGYELRRRDRLKQKAPPSASLTGEQLDENQPQPS